MAISALDIDAIAALLSEPASQDIAVAMLRRQFPALSVTRCDPSDVDAELPFRAWPHAALYLVDGADHCWRLTDDPARATGLVVVRAR